MSDLDSPTQPIKSFSPESRLKDKKKSLKSVSMAVSTNFSKSPVMKQSNTESQKMAEL